MLSTTGYEWRSEMKSCNALVLHSREYPMVFIPQRLWTIGSTQCFARFNSESHSKPAVVCFPQFYNHYKYGIWYQWKGSLNKLFNDTNYNKDNVIILKRDMINQTGISKLFLRSLYIFIQIHFKICTCVKVWLHHHQGNHSHPSQVSASTPTSSGTRFSPSSLVRQTTMSLSPDRWMMSSWSAPGVTLTPVT